MTNFLCQRTKTKNNKFILAIYIISVLYIIFTPFVKSFSYVDELSTLFLGGYILFTTPILRKKEFLLVLGILFFYLIYSFYLRINKYQAIILDLLLFLKPIICFYTMYYLHVSWTNKFKRVLKRIFLFLGIYCWCMLPFIENIYSNTAAFYPACILSSISYLYFSPQKKKNWYIALFLLLPGLFTFRSKFNTELICFIYLGFFLKGKFTLSIKYIIVILIIIIFSIYVNWTKFSLYFLSGEEDGIARTTFYYTAEKILADYFPLGSGFGTFGSEAAARYYSPLYYEYGVDSVYGMSPLDYGESSNFLVDTFYPILAEFGIIGIFLYVVFWIKRWKEANTLYNHNYRIFIFVLFFMLIQNIADATFISPISVPIMMMLGFTYSDSNRAEYEQKESFLSDFSTK